MATIADLLIKLGVDTSEADTKLKGFGAKASGAIKKGFVPAVAVLGGLAVVAKKATDAASDLSESQNAVSVVFGKSTGIIEKFSKNAAKQAGLSMKDLNEMVVPIGASLQNYGFSAKEAATSSVSLAKRAADMASVFNTSVPEALEAIQSGLRGEADPLEKFGVGLNDAAVKAYAVKTGLAKTTAGVSDNAKMQARLGLIMQQTNKYQGDFARTSGQMANKARINEAEQANLTAQLGMGLLPVMQALQAMIGKLLGFMASHQKATKVAAVVVASLAGAIVLLNVAMKAWGVLSAAGSAAASVWNNRQKVAAAGANVWAAAQWLLNAAMDANPIVLVVVAVAALVAGFVVAYRTSETFRGIVQAALAGVVTAAKAVASAFVWLWDKAKAVFGWGGWTIILSVIGGPFVAIALNIDKVKSALGAVLSGAQSIYNWGGWSAIGNVLSKPFHAAESAVSAVSDAIGGALHVAQQIVGWGGWAKIGGVIAAPFNAAIGAINKVVGAINAVISAANSALNLLSKLGSHNEAGRATIRARQKAGLNPMTGAKTTLMPGVKVPKGATGGIVTRPTLALIGEAGPEAVVPLNRTPGSSPLPGGMGGGPVIHVEKMVVQDASDAERVASALGRKLAMGMA